MQEYNVWSLFSLKLNCERLTGKFQSDSLSLIEHSLSRPVKERWPPSQCRTSEAGGRLSYLLLYLLLALFYHLPARLPCWMMARIWLKNERLDLGRRWRPLPLPRDQQHVFLDTFLELSSRPPREERLRPHIEVLHLLTSLHEGDSQRLGQHHGQGGRAERTETRRNANSSLHRTIARFTHNVPMKSIGNASMVTDGR